MKKVIEAFGTGATSEEALQDALKNLNAPADADVEKEIVDVQEKKILGLFRGSTVYKARAFYEKEVKEEAPVKAEKKQSVKAEGSKPEIKDEPEKKNVVVTVNEDGVAEKYIRNIIKGLGVEEDITITTEKEEGAVTFKLDCGDDYGCIIGRRGETLDAIQYLTRLVVNNEDNSVKRVTVNVGNYREKRANTLTELAKRNADKVIKYGRNVVLEPMNPYERRVIHTAIQQYDKVESYSIGSDDNRRVVIKLVDGVKPTRPSNGRGGRGGYNNRPKYDSRPKTNEPKSNSTPKSDVSSASLYGKIEPKNK